MLKQSALLISTLLLAGPALEARPSTSLGAGLNVVEGRQPAAQQRPAAVNRSTIARRA